MVTMWWQGAEPWPHTLGSETRGGLSCVESDDRSSTRDTIANFTVDHRTIRRILDGLQIKAYRIITYSETVRGLMRP